MEEERSHKTSPGEVMLETETPALMPLIEPGSLIYCWRMWVFFSKDSTKEQILNLEIVTVPIVEKNKAFQGREEFEL